MSVGTLHCLDSSRNTSDSLSVSDNLCKIIVEIGSGVFAGVCRSEGLVLWRSFASGTLLYCPLDLLSAERVRKVTLESDSLTAVTQEL
jgi:hypothetical protein